MPTYIITGANRGLGLEFVRQLSADNDNNTIIAAVRSLQGELDDLKQLASRPGAAQSKVHILECDTGDLASIQAFGDAVRDTLAGNPVDYLVNNAGINATPEETSLDMTAESLRRHIDINVVGPAETVKVLLPCLREGSAVMNLSSGLGSCGKKL
ncbi:hypothetical protein AYO21_06968 [Fonsecaea monophora]|uniref:Uncharacterized protein n=1 Tax=Fonsecaea monophora TaxID=254056 RepID=A0A177F3B4_9EURO|nr:hypothetical protein AYO21_06968 [Fonsecaea monophora]KAH0845867.1 C-signal protein [Fonsecaea pedrosoi]OAG38773.1 hypothetical protein AYO21_06968 [Fonsecaea monophora]